MNEVEKQLGRQVIDLARRFGVRAVHIPDSRRVEGVGASGLPDFLLLGNRLVFRELKAPTRGLDSDQVAWKYSLQAADIDTAIWRPLDLQTGHIAQELQALAPPWALPRG